MIALLLAATITIPAPKFKEGDAVIYYSNTDCPKGCPGEVGVVTYSESRGWCARGNTLGSLYMVRLCSIVVKTLSELRSLRRIANDRA